MATSRRLAHPRLMTTLPDVPQAVSYAAAATPAPDARLERMLREEPTAFSFFQAVACSRDFGRRAHRLAGGPTLPPRSYASRRARRSGFRRARSRRSPARGEPERWRRAGANDGQLFRAHRARRASCRTSIPSRRLRARGPGIPRCAIFSTCSITACCRCSTARGNRTSPRCSRRKAETIGFTPTCSTCLVSAPRASTGGCRCRILRSRSMLACCRFARARQTDSRGWWATTSTCRRRSSSSWASGGGWTRANSARSRRRRHDAGRLGFGVLGNAAWDVQARVRLRLGPLSRAQYDAFLPGGDAHGALCALVRLYAADEVGVDAQLVLARGEVPPCVLGPPARDGPAPPSSVGYLAGVAAARTRPRRNGVAALLRICADIT